MRVRVRGDAARSDRVSFELWIGQELAVERSFDPAPAACADLHAVVALAIAIALDDTLAGELGIVEPAPVEQVEAGAGDLPAFEDPPPPPDPPRPGPALALTPLALVAGGLSPSLTGGAGLSFDIRPREHFDIRMGGLLTHERGLPLDTALVDLTLAAGRLDLCWGTTPAFVRLRLCGGVAAGANISRGRGFNEDRTRATPWFAGLADVDVSVHLAGPLALELRVEGVFPVQRTRVDIMSESGEVLDSELLPPAGLLVGLGPRFEF